MMILCEIHSGGVQLVVVVRKLCSEQEKLGAWAIIFITG